MRMAQSIQISNLSNCRFYFQVFLTYLFSHVGLFGLIVGYAFVGAYIFESLEAPIELSQRSIFPGQREQFLKDLWDITNKLHVLYEKNWTMLVDARVKFFEKDVFNAVKNGVYDFKQDTELKWSFSGALLYCITIIFTIGYGRTSPKTDVGKVVTVFYALLGIPMSLLFFSNIGDILARSFKFIYSRVCCLCCNLRRINVVPSPKYFDGDHTKNFSDKLADVENIEICNNDEKSPTMGIFSVPSTQAGNSALLMTLEATIDVKKGIYKDSMSDGDQRVPIFIVLILLTGYVSGGAVVFSLWEKWTFFHGAFFCFMTLSTIGYGDVYFDVTFSEYVDNDANNEKYKKIFCCIYLVIGLAVLAMCFNLLQEELALKFRNLARTLGLIKSEKNDDDVD